MPAPSNAPKLKLYHYWRSSSSWRVRWALAHKGFALGTDVELEAVSLLDGSVESPDHIARNPFGFVPVLEFVGAPEPKRYLTESVAILEWVEEAFPSPSYFPADAFARARMRALVESVNAGTQPLQNLNAQYRHSDVPAERKAWAQHWLRVGMQGYETLVRRSAGKFSVGDSISAADFCLIPQCYNALRYEIPLEDYPTIHRIYREALETEAYRASEPERFKPE